MADDLPDNGPRAALVVSEAARHAESVRAEGAAPFVTVDDGQIELVPWRVPRPPDAPAPTVTRAGDPGRRAYVEQLWRALYAPTEIVTIVAARFGCHEATVERDIRRVREAYLKADQDPQVIATRKAQMRAAMTELMRRAAAHGDRQTERYVLDRLARLDGLYAPVKIEQAQTITIGLQIDAVVAVLDEAGLAALELVMAQLERAGLSIPAANPQPVLPAASYDADAHADDDGSAD